MIIKVWSVQNVALSSVTHTFHETGHKSLSLCKGIRIMQSLCLLKTLLGNGLLLPL